MAPHQIIARTIALVFSASLLCAQQPWEEPFHKDPAAVLSAVESFDPISGEHFADGIYQHTLFRWEADRRRTITQRTLYRVVNAAAGANVIRAAAAWAPWFQDRPKIKARVIAPDGQERWLDPKTLSEQAAAPNQPGAYEGVRALAAPLPGIADGVLVEIEVVMRDRRPMLDSPITESCGTRWAPCRCAGSWSRSTPPPTSTCSGKRTIFRTSTWRSRTKTGAAGSCSTWPTSKPSTVTPWCGLPSSGRYNLPTLRFSTGGAWSEVASAYNRLVEKQLDGKPVPGDWPAADKDRLSTITNLAKRVHEEVRYEALLLGQASIQPRRPAEILERGYGDCKDKALLLKALLAEAGIESRLALLRAATADDVDPELPGFGAFNHAILYLPGEQPLWIDATAELTPIGELPAKTQDRWALVVDAETTELIKTPASTSQDNRFAQRTDQSYQADGSVVMRTELEFFGALADASRQQMIQSADTYEKQARNYTGDGSSDYELQSFEADDPRSFESPFRVAFELRATPKGARYAQDQLAATHDFGAVLGPLPPTVWMTVNDDAEPGGLKLPAAYRSEIETRAVPPPGYKLRQLPSSARRELGPAFFETTWSVEEDGAVVAHTVFDTVVQEFDPEQATAFRKGLTELRQQKPETVVFENATSLGLRTSRFRSALEAAQLSIRQAPGDLFARTRLVDALLVAGAGVQAREGSSPAGGRVSRGSGRPPSARHSAFVWNSRPADRLA